MKVIQKYILIFWGGIFSIVCEIHHDTLMVMKLLKL